MEPMRGASTGRTGALRRKFMLANLIFMVVTCTVLILVMTFVKSWLPAVVVGIVMTGLSAAGTYMIMGLISGPVNALAGRISAMADDCNYTTEVPQFENGDELGSLSRSVDRLRHVQKAHIADLVRVLDSIGENNFNVEPQCEYPGDYQILREALLRITGRLNDSLQKIHDSASEISSATQQLSQGVQIVSNGSMTQSETVRELTGAMTDVYEHIRKNAADAALATELSLQAGGVMIQGGERLQEMMQAMEEIRLTSQKIGKVIKTVDDIAFQTNILALNASVEAARAGVAGKGFAVVADEVRSLANKSAEASKGTAGLIESAMHAIESGTSIAQQTADVFTNVMAKAKDATELTSGIATAIQEQEHVLERMKVDLEQISHVIHENSSTAQEGAAASEELTGQAHLLNEMMGKFILKRKGIYALRA